MKQTACLVISTHAPRTGSDDGVLGYSPIAFEFQPTLPARGATSAALLIFKRFPTFQPTLPARGATCASAASAPPSRYFNPRSPHGERQSAGGSTGGNRQDFNPRSPHGERRGGLGFLARVELISTHAPRTGSDMRVSMPRHSMRISTHAPRTGSD